MTVFPFSVVLLGASSTARERTGGLVVVLILLIFAAVGLDMVVRPRRHMNFYLRRGGEMLRACNELQVQLVGVLFACGSGWMLYQVVRDVWLG